jgi:hypothetical protein
MARIHEIIKELQDPGHTNDGFELNDTARMVTRAELAEALEAILEVLD